MPMWNFGYVMYRVGRDNVPFKVLNMMNCMFIMFKPTSKQEMNHIGMN